MNRRVTYHCVFLLVFASVVTVMATAARAAAEPVALSATLTLDELLTLSDEELAKVDIAALNLACAEGLPGSQHIDRRELLAKLDVWARFVAYETQRHRYRFEEHPEEYNHSWGEFAMLMMAMTLQQDLGVRYNSAQITPEDDPSGFDFTRSQDLFINGLLGGTGGTCTSMPVLYIAIGRRLGYPLKMVTTVDHSFLRWDDPETGGRFNIEGTSRGYGSYSDESYRHWPREWNDAERDSGDYLKSLTPREELAVFLTTRGDNLFFTGRLYDSLRCYDIARRMSPRNYSANYQYEQTARLIEKLEAEHRAEQAAREVEAAYQRHERRRRSDPRLMVPGMPAPPTAHPASRRQPDLAAQGHAVLLPARGHHVRPTTHAIGSFNRTGSIMPEFQADLEEQNRRN